MMGPIISFKTLPLLTELPGSRTFSISKSSLQSFISLLVSLMGNSGGGGGDSASSGGVQEEDMSGEEPGNDEQLDRVVISELESMLESSSELTANDLSLSFSVLLRSRADVFGVDFVIVFALRTLNNTNLT